MKQKVVVFDNNGKTYDRYTIIILKTGEIYGASHNPFNPCGFAQFSNTTIEAAFPRHAPEWFDNKIGWWPAKYVEIGNKAFIWEAKQELHLGTQVHDLTKLPEDVQRYIKQITSKDETLAT